MTLDLAGAATLIVAIGTLLTVVFAQYNLRRSIREAAAANQKEVGEVHALVDGKMSAALAKIEALSGEIRRLQHPDATTPVTDADVTLAPETGVVVVTETATPE